MSGKPTKRHAVTQPLDQSYRFIPLTKGQNAIVDAADYDWLMQWSWHAKEDYTTGNFYAARSYRCETNRKSIKKVLMHRAILRCTQGDHRNHNSLDNRRQNLRKATTLQNNRNAKLRYDSPSGFKGVNPSGNKWRARIRFNNKLIHLGVFTDPQEAARVYDEAAKKYHGEFAVLNFPPDEERPENVSPPAL